LIGMAVVKLRTSKAKFEAVGDKHWEEWSFVEVWFQLQ
jgi:hypothetical protein